MGLDAMVFCDCVEKGRLRTPHPYPRLLYITSGGSPEIRSTDPAKIDEHDKWMNLPPCEHEGMTLPGSFWGNATHISYLRTMFSDISRIHGPACPVLLGKVLYSGTHTGDHLTLRDVRKLSNELDRLKEAMPEATAVSSDDERQITLAIKGLRRLVKTALTVNKPIAF